MATTVTENALRRLAGFRAENGCAISIYVGLDPSSTPTIPDADTKFNAVLDGAERDAEAHADRRDCRLALRDDLDRIRAWWDRDFDRDGARGIALFASSADGFFEALPLPESVGDTVCIGHELYVTPLLSQLGRDGALVAFVSRERGTLYRYQAGRLVEVADESDDVPSQHDQGGWSQARYQRHIERIVQQHLKSVAQEVDKRARRAGGLQMVVVAPEEMRGEFESALSAEAREAIVGWATAEAHAGPNELAAVARPLLDAARAREDADAIARWEEAHGRGERAAAGWAETLEAASDSRVDVLLLEEASPRQAWRCPQDGRAFAEGGTCPLDGADLERVEDGGDLAVHQTLAHGGTVVRVGAGALGPAAEGIAALLRF
jgi:peptide chain release factor subunit 1